MRLRSLCRAGMALALPLAAASSVLAAAGPWVEHAEARVRLIGDRGGLGLEFELQPGWHVYWKNSGDAGYPPRLDFSATPAIRDARLLFPAPRRFDLAAGMVSFGYERAVLYPIAASLAAADGVPRTISARLDYLVCRDECIPHQADLALDLPARSDASGPESARLAAGRAALPLPSGSAPDGPRVNLRVLREADAGLTLEATIAGGIWKAAAPDLFFESHPLFALGRPELSVSKSGLRFHIRLQRLDLTRPTPATTTFAWTLAGFERTPGGGGPQPVSLAGATTVVLPR